MFGKLRKKIKFSEEDAKKKIRSTTDQKDPFKRPKGEEQVFHERMDKGELSQMKKDIEENNARIRREQEEERKKKKGF